MATKRSEAFTFSFLKEKVRNRTLRQYFHIKNAILKTRIAFSFCDSKFAIQQKKGSIT